MSMFHNVEAGEMHLAASALDLMLASCEHSWKCIARSPIDLFAVVAVNLYIN